PPRRPLCPSPTLFRSGALLIGPPDFSPLHTELTENRDEGSPVWRPVYDEGRHVRFAQFPEDDLDIPQGKPWEEPRIVYLQNASEDRKSTRLNSSHVKT